MKALNFTRMVGRRIRSITSIIEQERLKINKNLLTIARQKTKTETREQAFINIINSFNIIHEKYLQYKLNDETIVKSLLSSILVKINEVTRKLGTEIKNNEDGYICNLVFPSGKPIKFTEIKKVDEYKLDIIQKELEIVEIIDEESEDEENDSEFFKSTIEESIMSLTEFLGLASKLLPEFDGSADNLQRFLDALSIIDTIKGEFESTAVEIIKTKLKGSVRNVITSENTVQAIKNKLKDKIKGESVEVLTAKLSNSKQNNKSATVFSKEIEDITKLLENAYISDGLTSDLASKYATTATVKTLAKNANNSKTKIIMESGSFTSMNEALAKFINASNDANSNNQASVLYYNINNNRLYQNFNHTGRGRGYNNNSFPRRPQRYNNNGYSGHNNYSRGNFNNNRGQHFNRPNNNNNFNRSYQRNANVRYANHSQAENEETPQRVHLGEM